jgi:cellulose synthase/poly-beta-1,6-N-acetylglucosamine synthase-like glycosyltransferase
MKTSSRLPYVSIVIPCYNAQDSIAECLDSVVNLFYPKDKMEVIVVDNKSTDRSKDIIRYFPVKLLEEKEIQSSYAARNRGIKEAKGEWIAFTDADCIVDRNWLYYLMLKHQNDEKIGAIAGEILPHNPRTVIEIYSARRDFLNQRKFVFSIIQTAATANVAYRKSVFDRAGLFNDKTDTGADVEMAWRMQKLLGLKIGFAPEAIVFHRQRKSLVELYKQIYRYERAKIFLNTIIPEYYPLDDNLKADLKQRIFGAISKLPKRLKKFIKKEIDIVEFFSPFLDCIVAFARYRARKKYAPQFLYGARYY